MTAPTGWTRLSTDEFFLVWWAADLGAPPPILALPHIGRTPEQRKAAAEQASLTLADRGLGSVWQPRDDLVESMRALRDTALTLSLYADWQGEQRRAFLASGRSGSAIAVVSGDAAWLRPARPTGLAAALLENLDPLPAGAGHTANLRWADFARACAEGERDGTEAFLNALRDAGVRQPEARTVLRTVVGRRSDGEVEIGRRRRDGTPMPATEGARWVDTDEGRYAVRRRGEWLSIIPADVPKLGALLDEALTD